MTHTPQGGSAEHLPDAPRWREELLRQMIRWTSFFGGIIAIAIAYQALGPWALDVFSVSFVSMYLGYGIVLLTNWLPQLGYRFRASAVCVAYLLTATATLDAVGLGMGSALLLALFVLSAGLFLGRVALYAALFAGGAALVLFGHPISPEHYDNWVSLLTFVCLAGTLSAVVLFVVRSIENALAKTAHSLAQLRREEQMREAAQDELSKTQSALYQAQKLDAVGRLAAGVAHDFNNTLQVVLGWTELLQRSNDPADMREGIRQIQAAAEQSSGLTRQLLTFSRPELRRAQRLSVDALLPTIVKSYRRLIPDDISIHLDVQAGLDIVMDEAQLSQILLNLVLNARDAMPSGGRIEFHARQVPTSELPAFALGKFEDEVVEITVRDSGMGMTRETQERVFEPFFTTKGPLGTGLGLPTVYGVVQQAQGIVTVESAPGSGTCVRLFFPGSSELPDSRRPSALRSQPAIAGKQRLLLAEDDRGVRSSLALALRNAGYDVIEVADVESGLRELDRKRHPEILVTDGVMPGGNTRELISKFLTLRPEGRVILCSGYLDEELTARKVGAAGFEFLPKPFAPSDLVSKLRGTRSETT